MFLFSWCFEPCHLFDCREDAEAPKAHLVKPSSSSSGSRSSRSGSSSTRSTANSASRSQRTLSTEATPHLTPPQYGQRETERKEMEPKKVDYANLMKMGATLVMVPAQSRAFQTVWLLVWRLLLSRNTSHTTSHIGIVRLVSFLVSFILITCDYSRHEKPSHPTLSYIFQHWGSDTELFFWRKIHLREKGAFFLNYLFWMWNTTTARCCKHEMKPNLVVLKKGSTDI